jgi:uncharacterized protein YndB with AHSA1/START domain
MSSTYDVVSTRVFGAPVEQVWKACLDKMAEIFAK